MNRSTNKGRQGKCLGRTRDNSKIAQAVQVDNNGNLLATTPVGIGYGPGAGGAVTQATSKSTAVTLNKPCGRITMHNASLAANTTVRFTLNSTAIASTDLVVVNVNDNATNDVYLVWAEYARSGTVNICLRNISGGSLSEAVLLQYAVIKAVNA